MKYIDNQVFAWEIGLREEEDSQGRAFSENLESNLILKRQCEFCFLSEQCELGDSAAQGRCKGCWEQSWA